jgi:hypothetical protein
MSNKKNSENKVFGANEEDLRRETIGNESSSVTTMHKGKRSAFNEDADLATNPPNRKRDFTDPATEEGDEDYDDEETEHDDYFEDVHYKNEEIEILREEQKEYEGYGDDDFLDKP